MNTIKKIFVVIYDHPAVAKGINQLLIEFGITNVYCPLIEDPFEPTEEALWSYLDRLNPDLVILDANLRFGKFQRSARYGLRLLEWFRRYSLQPVIITSFESAESLKATLTSYMDDPGRKILNFGEACLEFIRLPAMRSEWQNKLAITETRISPTEYQPLKIALEQALSVESDRVLHHQMVNQRVALRILHGAKHDGWFSKSAYLSVLQKLLQIHSANPWMQIAINKRISGLEYESEWQSKEKTHVTPKRNALLIDDEAETAGWYWILNEILNRRFGLGVISVTDPEAGLKLLETRNDIDIVLLDVYFDGKSLGMQNLGRIREKKKQLPVLMFTAEYHDGILVRNCLHTSNVDYLIKERDEDTDPGKAKRYFQNLCDCVERLLKIAPSQIIQDSADIVLQDGNASDLKRYLDDAIRYRHQDTRASLMFSGLAFESLICLYTQSGKLDELFDNTSGYLAHRPYKGLLNLCRQMRNLGAHGLVNNEYLHPLDAEIALWALIGTIHRLRACPKLISLTLPNRKMEDNELDIPVNSYIRSLNNWLTFPDSTNMWHPIFKSIEKISNNYQKAGNVIQDLINSSISSLIFLSPGVAKDIDGVCRDLLKLHQDILTPGTYVSAHPQQILASTFALWDWWKTHYTALNRIPEHRLLVILIALRLIHLKQQLAGDKP